MLALHMVTTPGQRSPVNMSTILLTHPTWSRQSTQQVLTSSTLMPPKIQKLPRQLLMAWIEETHGRPGSQKVEEFWLSDVLLDRVTPTSIPDDAITNPFLNHPLAAQFDRFTSANKSLLPSLAFAGMSCHCINLVETLYTLEVLALFRYLLEKWEYICNAIPILEVFNVTLNSEPELLSLLWLGGSPYLGWTSSSQHHSS